MTRIFMLVLAAGICVVGFQLFGPGGAWFRAAELEEALALQNEANRVQQDRNEALGAELYSLEHRRDAIEERARRELYMVKADEVLFRLETPTIRAEGPRACEHAGLSLARHQAGRGTHLLRKALRPIPCAQEPACASLAHEASVGAQAA